MDTPILKLENLHRSYKMGKTAVAVLKGVEFELKRGEIVGLVGPSGSGKSTLLHAAGLLERPSSGTVVLDGQDCMSLNDRQRTLLRRTKIGFVYQFHNLLPEFNAVDNVCAPLYLSGVSKKDARAYGADLLSRLGLGERLTHQPMELSGGEQQRVAIARALANRPRLVIADEPTGSLDMRTTEKVFQQLTDIGRRDGVSMLIATHNLDLIQYMDRVVTLVDGKLTTYSTQ